MLILLGCIFLSGSELGTLQLFVRVSGCHFLKKKKRNEKRKDSISFSSFIRYLILHKKNRKKKENGKLIGTLFICYTFI
jgi:hypothetical protein